MADAIGVGGDGGVILHMLAEQHAKVIQQEKELAILRGQNSQFATEWKKLSTLFGSEPEWKGADGNTAATDVIAKIIERYRVDNGNLTESLRIATQERDNLRESLEKANRMLSDQAMQSVSDSALTGGSLGDPDETE